MKNPCAWIAFYFSLGILCAARIRVPFFAAWIPALCCLALAAVLSAALPARFPFISGIMFASGVFFAGAACTVNADLYPANHISRLIPVIADHECVVMGRIAGEPRFDKNRTLFDLETQRLDIGIGSYACTGSVRVKLAGTGKFEHGDVCEISGVVRLPSGFRGGRRMSERDYLRQHGIHALLYVRSPRLIRACPGFRRGHATACLLRTKKELQRRIRRHLSPVAAGVMEAMLLGDKTHIPRRVYADMITSGTVHILVVSGFNVGIIAGICVLCLKILRVRRLLRPAIIVPVLISYCVMTGASPPVVRATIMGIFLFLGWYVRRDPDASQALSLAALTILAFKPRELFDPSFQLSFSAVFALSVLSPRIEKLLRVDSIALRPVQWLARLGVASFSAWLGTAGFILYYFRILSPIAVLANVFIPVIASFITVCGVGLVAAEFLCSSVAYSFACVCEFSIAAMLRMNVFLIHIPGACWRLP